MAPDKIYVRQYRDGDTSWFWDDEPYEDEIAGIEAVEYIRKEVVEHIIRAALGPQDALNKIHSL